MRAAMNKTRRLLLPTLILLLAFGLRVLALNHFPPGLTHDEANHGREALEILSGVFRFYFPLNYGSEPLYSYTAAGSLLLFGRTLFSLRLVNVLFGTAVLAITYAWTARAFDRRTALLTIGLLAVSFWPLASSRQALRAGMLPFFFGTAVYCFWQFSFASVTRRQRRLWTMGFGVAVAITLHIYLAARVAWLLFPLFLIYLLIFHRPRFKQAVLPTLAGLLLAGLLITPMFLYLDQNPYALTRLEMLDGPLQQLRSGNFQPVLDNIIEALLAFIWPGYGDTFLAYNIPGRPVFDGLTAVFAVAGLIVALYRWKQPAFAMALLWFGVGIIPSLVTGATANTTRNLAALVPIHLLPAIGAATLLQLAGRPVPQTAGRWTTAVFATGWLLFAGTVTVRDYFVRWGNLPQVRGAYQHNLVVSLHYLDTQPAPPETVLFSSALPGPAHDPSISLLLTARQLYDERWMDARFALLMPDQPNVRAIIPQSTPPAPALARWLVPLQTLSLRPTDLDPSFTYYEVNPEQTAVYAAAPTLANFNNAIALRYAEWLDSTVAPGETAVLLTVWQVADPTQIGPVVPPTFTTNVTMFAQLLNPDGTLMAQRVALDAPSWSWQTGDWLVQLQPIALPAETPAGEYGGIVGFYDEFTDTRTPVLDDNGQPVETFTAVPPLVVLGDKAGPAGDQP